MRLVRLALLLSLCQLACWPAAQAHADSPYRLYPAADALALGVSAVTWWVPSLFRASFVAAEGCPCSAARLNGFDRWAAGSYRPGWSAVGDIAVAGVYTLAVLLDALDVHNAKEPLTSFLTDLTVMAQALLVSGAVDEITKISTHEPRPLLYGRAASDPALRDPENYVSFYSGHTAGAFTVGLAYAQTFAYRHPHSPLRFWVYAAALAAGSGIGMTRVAAGKHFPSDVLVGAAAGAGFGLLIPWLHKRAPGAQLSVQAAPGWLGLSLWLGAL